MSRFFTDFEFIFQFFFHTRHVFLRSYKLQYSKDGKNWKTVQKYKYKRPSIYFRGDGVPNGADDLIFRGNIDANKVQYNFMPRLIIAKYYRIRPWSWKERICVRLELFGCKYEVGMSDLPVGANTEFKKDSQLGKD